MISKRASEKTKRRFKIRTRIRSTINGTVSRPRLSVYRSNREIYAQLIDDEHGVTLTSCSSMSNANIDRKKMNNVEIATEIGKQLAQKAADLNISAVVFDRGGYLYHGRVKALAEGAREGGLKF